MSEKSELKIASSESIAYELTHEIANKEKLFNRIETYRKEILDLYAECLEATNGHREIE